MMLSRRTFTAATISGLSVLAERGAPAGAAITSPEFGFTPMSFSRAERDRRWSVVRSEMAKPGWNLDAILTTGSDIPGDYARYLTQIGNRPGSGDGPEVVFPRDPGRPAYAQLGMGYKPWSQRITPWLADGGLVLTDRSGTTALVAAVKERGLDAPGTRIGVARLSGSRFHPEGLVSATYLEALRRGLPGVEFVAIDRWGPDSGPVERAAMIKGREEIEVLRRCVAANESGLDAMVAAVRSGAQRQADVWYAGYNAMFSRTGEDPTRLSLAFDAAANTTLGEPSPDAVRRGSIGLQEIDATVHGYRAQINHGFFVGATTTTGYRYYEAGMQIAAGLVRDVMRFVVPNKTTCGDVVRWYLGQVAAAGATDTSIVNFHSSGIDNLTRPRLGPENGQRDYDIVIVPGMAFDFKPQFRFKREVRQDAGPENRDVQIGEHLLATESGLVRLGNRALGPLVAAR